MDLSAEFTDAARYLTERTGQTDWVSFEAGNALELPFKDGRFDAVIRELNDPVTALSKGEMACTL